MRWVFQSGPSFFTVTHLSLPFFVPTPHTATSRPLHVPGTDLCHVKHVQGTCQGTWNPTDTKPRTLLPRFDPLASRMLILTVPRPTLRCMGTGMKKHVLLPQRKANAPAFARALRCVLSLWCCCCCCSRAAAAGGRATAAALVLCHCCAAALLLLLLPLPLPPLLPLPVHLQM